MAQPRYLSWLMQSESDLRSARHLCSANFFAQACFNAQQSAEKALKALAFYRGSDLVKSPSLSTIAKDLGINGELANFAAKLDIYYLTARYPDALPDNAVPSDQFTREMAEEATRMSQPFLDKVNQELKT